MGPKKKAKSPKKTVAQLEEEKRVLDEERQRLQIEEKNRREEERKNQEILDAIRREEEKKNRAAELERLQSEHEKTKNDIFGKEQSLAEILRVQKEAAEWKKYLACAARPDPESQGDINSYLNSLQLDASTDFSEVCLSCNNAIEVIQDLQYVHASAIATNDTALSTQCINFIEKIQDVIVRKLEFATSRALEYSDEYSDGESSGDIKISSTSEWIKIGLWINLIAKASRNKKIDFSDLGIMVELPKAVIAHSLALRVAHLPFDSFSQQNISNLDVSIGGVFSIELLVIPPPPKRARGWLMREAQVSPSIDDFDASTLHLVRRLHYPLEGMVISAAPPIKVSLVLPNHVLYPTDIRIGWWNPTNQTWEEDGISEVTYSPESSTVTFWTLRLTHLAVLQQGDLNHGKIDWNIMMKANNALSAPMSTSCISQNAQNLAHIQFKSSHRDMFHFEVTELGCRLLGPLSPQLVQLSQSYYPPGELLTRLSRKGVELSPSFDDDTRFQFVPKVQLLEDRVIREVASIVSAFEVCTASVDMLESDEQGNITKAGTVAAEWLESAKMNPNQILLLVREISWPYITPTYPSTGHGNGHPVQPPIFSYVNVLAEIDDAASGGGVKFRVDQNQDQWETHVHLKNALGNIASPDAKDRMENSNVMFEFVLFKLLRLLRIFSYSQPQRLRSAPVVRKIGTATDLMTEKMAKSTRTKKKKHESSEAKLIEPSSDISSIDEETDDGRNDDASTKEIIKNIDPEEVDVLQDNFESIV